jgi:hypothetical protein
MRRTVVAAIALLLFVGACGDKKKEAAPPRPRPTTTTTAPAVAPLTGLPMVDGVSAARPALTVKVENAPEARPQAGLESADIVYEEQVEGGLTRFLAVFHSTDAATVGPIRSIRPTDPDVVRPIGGLFAYSGGTQKFIGMLRATSLQDIGFDTESKLYEKRRDKRAPHNLYSSTERFYGAAKDGLTAPPVAFTFLKKGEVFAPAEPPVTLLSLRIGQTPVNYEWDAPLGAWKRVMNRTPHLVEGGAQLASTNVVVQFVHYSNSPGDFDVVGNPVSVANVVGTGEAWVLAGGKVVKGAWAKPSPDALTTFTDAAGAPIALSPGRTWVVLVQAGSAATVQ